MKQLFVFIVALLSFTEVVYACPNFEGRYTFVEEPWNGTIKVEQKDCQSLTITRVREWKGRHTEDVKVIQVDAAIHGSTMAYWLDHQLVVQEYIGSEPDCQGQYMFNDSKCHLTETSLQQNGGKGEVFQFSQTGIWWKENGKYQKEHYTVVRESSNLNFVPRYAQN